LANESAQCNALGVFHNLSKSRDSFVSTFTKVAGRDVFSRMSSKTETHRFR